MAYDEDPRGLDSFDPLEQSLVGRLIQDPELVDQAQASGLRAIHWREGHARDCFAAVSMMRADGNLTAASVLNSLREAGKHSLPVEAWLTHGCSQPWAHEPLEAFELILQRYRFRQLEKLTHRAAEVARSRTVPALQIIDQTMEALTRLALVGQAGDNGDVHDDLCALVDEMESGRGKTAWRTGFRLLDQWFSGGIGAGELCIVAASSGVGKSSLAQSFVRQTLADGGIVGLWSLEMPRRQVLRRLLSQDTGIPLATLKMGGRHIPPARWSDISATVADIDGPRLRIFDAAGASAADVRAQALTLCRKGPAMLVVDQLDIMTHPTTHGAATHANIRETAKSLKRLAMSLQVPVVLLHQLNKDAMKRQAGNGQGKSSMGDLRDASVENDADQVIFIERPEHFLKDECPEDARGKARIVVQKNRDGPSGAFWCIFERECALFRDEVESDGF